MDVSLQAFTCTDVPVLSNHFCDGWTKVLWAVGPSDVMVQFLLMHIHIECESQWLHPLLQRLSKLLENEFHAVEEVRTKIWLNIFRCYLWMIDLMFCLNWPNLWLARCRWHGCSFNLSWLYLSRFSDIIIRRVWQSLPSEIQLL